VQPIFSATLPIAAQFTADAFASGPQAAGVRISMDGRGAWRNNVFIERFWWTLKHEEVYLKAYASVWDARQSTSNYISFYNAERSHSSLQDRTPVDAYTRSQPAAPASLPLPAPNQSQAQARSLCQNLRTKRKCPTGGFPFQCVVNRGGHVVNCSGFGTCWVASRLGAAICVA